MMLGEIHVELKITLLTAVQVKQIKSGDDVYVGLVREWHGNGKPTVVLLQKAGRYWHSAYTHDTTYNEDDVLDIFKVHIDE